MYTIVLTEGQTLPLTLDLRHEGGLPVPPSELPAWSLSPLPGLTLTVAPGGLTATLTVVRGTTGTAFLDVAARATVYGETPGLVADRAMVVVLPRLPGLRIVPGAPTDRVNVPETPAPVVATPPVPGSHVSLDRGAIDAALFSVVAEPESDEYRRTLRVRRADWPRVRPALLGLPAPDSASPTGFVSVDYQEVEGEDPDWLQVLLIYQPSPGGTS